MKIVKMNHNELTEFMKWLEEKSNGTQMALKVLEYWLNKYRSELGEKSE